MPLMRPSFSSRSLALSLLLATPIAGVVGCEKKHEQTAAKRDTSVPVSLKPVKIEPVQRTIEVFGTLYGDEELMVSNKVNGKVIAIYKDIGDRAEPGEPLAQLLQNDYQLDINQKKAALQEILAKLTLKDLPPDNFDPTTLPSVRKAALQTKNAQEKFNRGKELHESDPPLLSDQAFDDLKTELDVAKTNYDQEVVAARTMLSEVKTRQAELAIANQALADTTVRAPRDKYDSASEEGSATTQTSPGNEPKSALTQKAKRSYTIVARMCSVGELEKAVTPLFKLVDDDPVKLRASVPERYVSQIKVGQKASLTIAAYVEPFEGQVSRVNPQVDLGNRTFSIEILVPNPDHKIPPGAFGRAQVQTRVDPKVVFVPMESVISFAGVSKVFTVKDGKAVEHGVELGERHGEYLEAIKGLKGGEQVVVNGASKLANGVPVAIQQSAPEKVEKPVASTITSPSSAAQDK